jgi:hypothetical protein
MATPPTVVPQVVDYLYTTFVASVPDTVKVFDGPPTVDDVPSDFVCVAYADDEEASAVDGSRDVSPFGNGTYYETFTVRCQINSFTGDNDLKPRRDRVSQIYGGLVALVDADRSLGGVIVPPGYAEIGNFTWSQDPYEDGSAVSCVFDISVTNALLWSQ